MVMARQKAPGDFRPSDSAGARASKLDEAFSMVWRRIADVESQQGSASGVRLTCGHTETMPDVHGTNRDHDKRYLPRVAFKNSVLRLARLGIGADADATASLKLTTIPALATASTLILVSDSGVIKSRTPVQILSDIGAAASSHNHDSRYYTESEVDALLDAQDALSELGDVTISGPADNDLLQYDNATGRWVDRTLAEAGVAAASHNHAASDVTSGTFADARISESSVTQHEAALSIADTQLTGTDWTDLTDSGDTTLHIHDARYYTEAESDAAFADIAHLHDGDVLCHDGVNSDSAAFAFNTGGRVTANQEWLLRRLYLTDQPTNNATKNCRLRGYNYASDAEDEGWTLVYGYALAASNELRIGGGDGYSNAATEIQFYVAANPTTRTGLSALKLDSNREAWFYGIVHAYLGASGASPVANSAAVIERNGDCYMSMLVPSGDVTGIYFGSSVDNDVGGIVYDTDNDNLTIRTGGTWKMSFNGGTAISINLPLIGSSELVLQNSALNGCKINSDGDLQMDAGEYFRTGHDPTWGTASVTGTVPFKDASGNIRYWCVTSSAAT